MCADGPGRAHAHLLTATDHVAGRWVGSINMDIMFYIMYFKMITMETYCSHNGNYNNVYKKPVTGREGSREA